MAVIFDKSVFHDFKPRSIQKSEELVIGETYYMVGFDKVTEFQLLELKTHAAHYTDIGLKDNVDPEHDNYLAWAVMMKNEKKETFSLQDTNIDGGGYNPYMLFSTRDIADQYLNVIDMEFVSEYWHDYSY
jgi:hypothetical protein